jgi:membrane-associated phospholipid phosphatase
VRANRFSCLQSQVDRRRTNRARCSRKSPRNRGCNESEDQGKQDENENRHPVGNVSPRSGWVKRPFMTTTLAPTRTTSLDRTRRHDGWTIPVLEPARRGPAERFAAAFGPSRHPAVVFFSTLLLGYVIITALSIAAGFVLVDGVAHLWGVGAADRHFDGWLAAHRTPGRTEASLIGSIAAGGVVLPVVVGVIGILLAALQKWRIAAFVVFALAVESAAYRVTTLVFHEHRPRVVRLEHLPVNASYPSGHTAASIAVYGGLVLLLTSRFHNPGLRAVAWTVAIAIPLYVGLSRMYRGMHFPLDVAGGALVGIATLAVMVLACRTAGAAAESRAMHRRAAR